MSTAEFNEEPLSLSINTNRSKKNSKKKSSDLVQLSPSLSFLYEFPLSSFSQSNSKCIIPACSLPTHGVKPLQQLVIDELQRLSRASNMPAYTASSTDSLHAQNHEISTLFQWISTDLTQKLKRDMHAFQYRFDSSNSSTSTDYIQQYCLNSLTLFSAAFEAVSAIGTSTNILFGRCIASLWAHAVTFMSDLFGKFSLASNAVHQNFSSLEREMEEINLMASDQKKKVHEIHQLYLKECFKNLQRNVDNSILSRALDQKKKELDQNLMRLKSTEKTASELFLASVKSASKNKKKSVKNSSSSKNISLPKDISSPNNISSNISSNNISSNNITSNNSSLNNVSSPNNITSPKINSLSAINLLNHSTHAEGNGSDQQNDTSEQEEDTDEEMPLNSDALSSKENAYLNIVYSASDSIKQLEVQSTENEKHIEKLKLQSTRLNSFMNTFKQLQKICEKRVLVSTEQQTDWSFSCNSSMFAENVITVEDIKDEHRKWENYEEIDEENAKQLGMSYILNDLSELNKRHRKHYAKNNNKSINNSNNTSNSSSNNNNDLSDIEDGVVSSKTSNANSASNNSGFLIKYAIKPNASFHSYLGLHQGVFIGAKSILTTPSLSRTVALLEGLLYYHQKNDSIQSPFNFALACSKWIEKRLNLVKDAQNGIKTIQNRTTSKNILHVQIGDATVMKKTFSRIDFLMELIEGMRTYWNESGTVRSFAALLGFISPIGIALPLDACRFYEKAHSYVEMMLHAQHHFYVLREYYHAKYNQYPYVAEPPSKIEEANSPSNLAPSNLAPSNLASLNSNTGNNNSTLSKQEKGAKNFLFRLEYINQMISSKGKDDSNRRESSAFMQQGQNNNRLTPSNNLKRSMTQLPALNTLSQSSNFRSDNGISGTNLMSSPINNSASNNNTNNNSNNNNNNITTNNNNNTNNNNTTSSNNNNHQMFMNGQTGLVYFDGHPYVGKWLNKRGWWLECLTSSQTNVFACNEPNNTKHIVRQGLLQEQNLMLRMKSLLSVPEQRCINYLSCDSTARESCDAFLALPLKNLVSNKAVKFANAASNFVSVVYEDEIVSMKASSSKINLSNSFNRNQLEREKAFYVLQKMFCYLPFKERQCVINSILKGSSSSKNISSNNNYSNNTNTTTNINNTNTNNSNSNNAIVNNSSSGTSLLNNFKSIKSFNKNVTTNKTNSITSINKEVMYPDASIVHETAENAIAVQFEYSMQNHKKNIMNEYVLKPHLLNAPSNNNDKENASNNNDSITALQQQAKSKKEQFNDAENKLTFFVESDLFLERTLWAHVHEQRQIEYKFVKECSVILDQSRFLHASNQTFNESIDFGSFWSLCMKAVEICVPSLPSALEQKHLTNNISLNRIFDVSSNNHASNNNENEPTTKQRNSGGTSSNNNSSNNNINKEGDRSHATLFSNLFPSRPRQRTRRLFACNEQTLLRLWMECIDERNSLLSKIDNMKRASENGTNQIQSYTDFIKNLCGPEDSKIDMGMSLLRGNLMRSMQGEVLMRSSLIPGVRNGPRVNLMLLESFKDGDDFFGRSTSKSLSSKKQLKNNSGSDDSDDGEDDVENFDENENNDSSSIFDDDLFAESFHVLKSSFSTLSNRINKVQTALKKEYLSSITTTNNNNNNNINNNTANTANNNPAPSSTRLSLQKELKTNSNSNNSNSSNNLDANQNLNLKHPKAFLINLSEQQQRSIIARGTTTSKILRQKIPLQVVYSVFKNHQLILDENLRRETAFETISPVLTGWMIRSKLRKDSIAASTIYKQNIPNFLSEIIQRK